jgi:predicted Zn-dependent peptidase
MRASAMVRARLQGLPTEQLIDLPQILSLITPEEVKNAARQYLNMNTFECVILTDVDSHPELSKVTKLFDQVIKVQANDAPESVLELSS